MDLQLSEQARRETELNNEKVKKNREILKRLMDCVMFLGKQELSFRGHNESPQSLNRGNYVELLSFLAEHDADLHYHLSTNRVFTFTSGKIQNDLIYAIAEVMGEEIKMEIKRAPGVFSGVQAKVKKMAPMALFIHCYAHRLNLVLTQGASKLKECKVFFANLNGLAAFFSRSPKRTQLLDDMYKRRLPHVAPMRWQYTSRLVNAVFEKRVALKELFDHILEHHDEYDEDTVLSADGFNARLEDFEFCFLLKTFNGIFEYAGVLFGILQTKTLDVEFCMARVNEFCDTVEQARGKFSEIYEETVRVSGGPSVRRGQGTAQGDLRAHFQKLHNSILDNILSQIRNRFQDHEMFMFLSLLNSQHFQTYRKKLPQAAFSSLTQSHGTLFDLPRLKTELTVMYAMADFEGKSPADLHDFLLSKNLSESMGQLYALACLAVTIPVSTASVEHSFSALKRLKTYARNTTGQTRLSALASMSIEKDLLMDLKRTDKLYNRAIELFLRKERRMDFIIK